MAIILIQIVLVFASFPYTHSSVLLKGNLLFEEIGGQQLNQEFMTFSRKVDTSDLENFAFTLLSSATLYHNFCDSIQTLDMEARAKEFKPVPTYRQAGWSTFANAIASCKAKEAQLPEVRTVQDKRDLEDIMKQYNVTQARAGIQYDKISNQYHYITDDTDASMGSIFPHVHYGGEYANKMYEADWTNDGYLKGFAEKYPLAYTMTPYGIKLRMMDHGTLGQSTTILCEKRSTVPQHTVESNVLIQVATHACKRDLQSIMDTTTSSVDEIRTIVNLEFNFTNGKTTLDNFLPTMTRNKRDLTTLAAMGTFGSIIGGTSYVLRSILDAVFGNTRYAKKSDLLKVAHKVDDLKINQDELIAVTTKIRSAIEKLEIEITELYTGIATLNMGSEIRNLNRYLQTVLTTTLLKYSQALMAAKDKRTHPYALSQNELKDLSLRTFSTYKVHLDTNINNVQTGVIIDNNTIVFIFDIPVIQQDKMFNFYTIIPMPTFQNNETFYPDVDAFNIAISKFGDKYTTLSDKEMQKCANDPPVCSSRIPITPMTTQKLCVVATYTSSSLKCPLKQSTQKLKPFLYFQDAKLFYSVPHNTSLYIKCHKTLQHADYYEQTVIITGIGEAVYRPSCTINLPDGTSYSTPSDSVVHVLQDWPIFNIQKALPHETLTQIVLPTFTESSTFTVANQTETKSIVDTFDKYDMVDFSIFLFSTIAPIAVVAIVACCCYPRFKRWLSNKLYQVPEIHESPKITSHKNFWYDEETGLPIPTGSPILKTTAL